jgi:hypothetical protein
MSQQNAKKTKRPNPFNRLPINPPKDWREKYTLPGKEYRVIPK